jgi:peptidyl-prolyl cis-trans isomerase D
MLGTRQRRGRKENSVLDLMRRHAKSWLIKVALGGVIIVFIFWYGWSGPIEEDRNEVAKVNDQVISYDQFNTVYSSEMEKLRLRFKDGIPEGLLDKMDMKQEVLKRLINRVLLLQTARSLGFTVTNEDLVEDIASFPYFQRNGVFDDQMYHAYLRGIKLTASTYETLRKEELLEARLAGLLTDGVKTDPQEIKSFWHFQNDKLVLAVAVIKTDQASSGEAPNETALSEFFRKNEKKYEIPASVDLEYVSFSWKDVAKEVSVDEEEARAYYFNQPKEFTTPETVRARHIVLKAPADADEATESALKTKIEEIRKKIIEGADFAKTAEAESQDDTAPKGGDLGVIVKGTLSPQIEEKAFSLAPGEISEPLRSQQGFHILKVEEKKEERTAPFEEVAAKIKDKLIEEKARRKAAELADSFYEKAYRSEDLRESAKDFGLEVKTAEGVAKAVGLPGMGPNREVMDEAFHLKEGDLSKLISAGDTYTLMRIVKVTPERIPPLQDVLKQVTQDYIAEAAMEAARKKAADLVAALRVPGADPEETAAKFGTSWEALDPVSRTTGLVPRLGAGPEVQELLSTISSAAPVFAAPIQVDGGMAVVRLKSSEKATDEAYEKERAAFEKWVTEVRRAEFLQGWLKVFESKAKVTANKKL